MMAFGDPAILATAGAASSRFSLQSARNVTGLRSLCSPGGELASEMGKGIGMQVETIDHIVLNVRDVEVSAQWYARVLGMSRETAAAEDGGQTRTSLRFGRQKINLRPMAATQAEWFTGRQPATGSADLCFLVTASPEDVVRSLAEEGVDVEVGPVTKKGAQGLIRSVYCRDPDGSLIELSSYDR